MSRRSVVGTAGAAVVALAALSSPSAGPTQVAAQGPAPASNVYRRDPQIGALVARLDLDRYRAAIKGLTVFGDRRAGTQRNRDAVAWIEAQLRDAGCTATERFAYDASSAPRGAGAGRSGSRGQPRTPTGTPDDPIRRGAGGKGFGAPTGVNNDPERQPDVRLRELDSRPVLEGPRDVVYCTKVGASVPDEMYIVSAHMDGIGYGEAANDDGSGTALVMELARVFSSPDVVSERSIRFILWNSEEQGELGARAYVARREALQGKEDPPGSGRYPEPKWLGVIQHDMMLWDHGMPAPDGRVSPWQRPEADVNIEFQENSTMAAESEKLAWLAKEANVRYASAYPATVGKYMQSTDSAAFQDVAPAISLRENERRDQIGYGWDPNWHQPTDVLSTYSTKDLLLGLNAAQTTLALVAQLAGATQRERSPAPMREQR